ncbi:MAG: alginate lyase family protein [Runella sp.]
MGIRYVAFRLKYEGLRRSGWLKKTYPVSPPWRTWVTLSEWKKSATPFFFESREALANAQSFVLSDAEKTDLKVKIEHYRRGEILFFNSEYYKVNDWLTNPANQYRYDAHQHWSQIADFSPAAGDIKYVWEKSRFSFLYTLIRYDFHTKNDLSEIVFSEIESWIEANPINCGPNWRCSQEISLRVLNWTFALFYYKNAPALTDARFAKIIHSIYWQMRHVESNIDFSRIAVRNNHAITETLTLYLAGLLFPFFDESARWKKNGKRWFEEEIAYQIYEDGTFLQFSMNYHRVVVQLLTWGIRLAHLHREQFEAGVYNRARKTLEFLRACQNPHTGWLPNYGNNDGALFFPLSCAHFRDYRPQLEALEAVLNSSKGKNTPQKVVGEDSFWYGLAYKFPQNDLMIQSIIHSPIHSFKDSGYYLFRDTDDSLTFLRCGSYRHRPFQADNLHLDLWVGSENILRDAGSYLYNTDEKWLRYFAGTASHNTVMLDHHDQMQKGPRFIWYDWVKKALGHWQETETAWIFEGEIRAFQHLGRNIKHRRRVTKTKNQVHWIVEDWLENTPNDLQMHQIWHPSDYFINHFSLRAFLENNIELTVAETEGWYSSLYGKKEPTPRLIFSTTQRYIKTQIFALPLQKNH